MNLRKFTAAAALVIAAFSSSLMAKEVGSKTQDQVEDQFDCSVLADVAEGIMDARQSGVAEDTQLAFAEAAEPPFSQMLRSIVIRAYERPLHDDEKMQRREVQDFRDMIEIACPQAY